MARIKGSKNKAHKSSRKGIKKGQIYKSAPSKKPKGDHLFKKGNEVWKLAPGFGVGTKKKFSTPEDLWNAAVRYFQWCEENPLMEAKYQDGKMREIPHHRPYTWDALCVSIGVSRSYFTEFRSAKRENKEAYMVVINQIDMCMKTQKFEGAATGFFNANLIARDIGLAERVDHTSGGEEIKAPVINIITSSDVPKFANSEKDVKDQTKKTKNEN